MCIITAALFTDCTRQETLSEASDVLNTKSLIQLTQDDIKYALYSDPIYTYEEADSLAKNMALLHNLCMEEIGHMIYDGKIGVDLYLVMFNEQIREYFVTSMAEKYTAIAYGEDALTVAKEIDKIEPFTRQLIINDAISNSPRYQEVISHIRNLYNEKDAELYTYISNMDRDIFDICEPYRNFKSVLPLICCKRMFEYSQEYWHYNSIFWTTPMLEAGKNYSGEGSGNEGGDGNEGGTGDGEGGGDKDNGDTEWLDDLKNVAVSDAVGALEGALIGISTVGPAITIPGVNTAAGTAILATTLKTALISSMTACITNIATDIMLGHAYTTAVPQSKNNDENTSQN